MTKSLLSVLALAASLQLDAQFSTYFYVEHATCGSATGSITVSVWGGIAPYTFVWSPAPPNGQGTQVITDVPAGTWSVTITDANATSVTVDTTIVQTQDLFLPITPPDAWTCDPGCFGTWYYYVPLSNGTYTTTFDPPGPNGIASPNGLSFNSLCVGSYTVTIDDGNGCTGTISPLNVVGPMNPLILDTIVTASCPNGTTGSFTVLFDNIDSLFVTGPDGVWYAETANPFTATNLGPGTYYLHASISNSTPPGGSQGCYVTYTVTVPVTTDPCGTIDGVVYADLDGDCAMAGSDIGIPYRVLTIQPGDQYTLTDANGLYATELFYGSYGLDPTIDGYDVICPDPIPANFTLDAANPSGTIDVAQDPLNGPDVWAHLYTTAHRVGFTTTYTLTVFNEGPWPFTDLALHLQYDPLLGFVSSTGTPTVPGVGELEWAIPSLGGFSTVQFVVTLMVPANPALIGTQVNATATVIPVPADADPSNDAYTITRTIVNSVDPNGKEARTSTNGDVLYFIDVDQYVDYTMHFQNTGTAEAVDVYLLDTISAVYDITSLEILAASHAFTASLDDRVLRFDFPNINLPDSTSNEPASHGFASFRLKPSPLPTPGQLLTNTADIFFDFNDPIHTNTSVLVAEYSVGINEDAIATGRISPNPVGDVLYFNSDLQPRSMDVLSVDGRVLMTSKALSGRMNVGSLPHGTYLLRVRSSSGAMEHHRFVKN